MKIIKKFSLKLFNFDSIEFQDFIMHIVDYKKFFFFIECDLKLKSKIYERKNQMLY